MTIGGDLPGNGDADVVFSPGFAGGDGVQSAVKGTSFSEANGGYLDSDSITTPVTPDANGEILIAQFSLPNDTTFACYSGLANFRSPGDPPGGFMSAPFSLCVVGPAPIPTLSEWGLIVCGLLLLTAGTIVLRRQAAPGALAV